MTVWGAFGKLYADSELEKRIEDYDYYKQQLPKTKNVEFKLACPLFGDETSGQKRVPLSYTCHNTKANCLDL